MMPDQSTEMEPSLMTNRTPGQALRLECLRMAIDCQPVRIDDDRDVVAAILATARAFYTFVEGGDE